MEKLTHFLSKILEEKYGLKNAIFIEKANGYSAQNYIVKVNSELFILKKYRSFNETEIVRIEEISLFLFENNISIVLPIKTIDSLLHFESNGYYYALFPKVQGKVLHEPAFTPKVLDEAANLLNKLHCTTSTCHLDLLTAKNIAKISFENKSEKIFALLEETSFKNSIDQLTKDLIEIKSKLFKQILINHNFDNFLSNHDFVHGDFHNENLLFDSNQKITCLLDFEEVHYGNKLEDVAHFILISCFNSGFEKINFSNARQFLTTYMKISNTTNTEIQEAIYYLIGKFSSSFFLEEMLYITKDLLFVSLLERDVKKYHYFLHHLFNFSNQLIKGL